MAVSNTSRTLTELKKRGYRCGMVERFLRYAGPHGMRQDLFGIIDIIALDHDTGVIGVQSCGQAHSAHYKKLTEERSEDTMHWLLTPGTSLFIYSWTKRKRKLKNKKWSKKGFWTPRIEEITMEMLK